MSKCSDRVVGLVADRAPDITDGFFADFGAQYPTEKAYFFRKSTVCHRCLNAMIRKHGINLLFIHEAVAFTGQGSLASIGGDLGCDIYIVADC